MRSKGLSLRDSENELKMGLVILVLIVAALLTVMVATGMGPVSVSPETTAKILLSRIPGVGKNIVQDWKPVEQNIVLVLRLPRVCLGLVVGASLAVCGVTMQALVRNNLADPFILGVSSGAAAFATLGMLFGVFSFLGTYSLSISAFFGAAIFFMIAWKRIFESEELRQQRKKFVLQRGRQMQKNL